MTTLAQGSSVTLSVGDNGTVSIATNGGLASAVITPTVGSQSVIAIGPQPERRKLGPFAEGASVTLSNSTVGVFDYDASSGQFDNATAASLQAMVAADRKFAACIPFGDSITGNGSASSPGVPTNLYGQAWYWQAAALAGVPMDFPYIAGRAGYRTDQLDPFFAAEVVAARPACCTIMAGTNDPDLAATTVIAPATKTTIGYLQSWYEQAVAANVYVYAMTITPRPAVSAQKKADILYVNQWIRDYWRDKPGGECVDAFAAMVDPTSTSQATVSGTPLEDNTHPNIYGCQLIARALSPRLLARYGVGSILVCSAMDDSSVVASSAQRCTNPLMLNPGSFTGTGITGNMPSGWNASMSNGSATAVMSVVARADGFGNDTVATGNATGACRLKIGRVSAPSLTVGKRPRMSAAISISSSTPCIGSVQLAIQSTTVGLGGPNGTSSYPLRSGDYVYHSLLGAPYVSGTPWHEFYIDFIAAGDFVVKIGRVSVREYA